MLEKKSWRPGLWWELSVKHLVACAELETEVERQSCNTGGRVSGRDFCFTRNDATCE